MAVSGSNNRIIMAIYQQLLKICFAYNILNKEQMLQNANYCYNFFNFDNL